MYVIVEVQTSDKISIHFLKICFYTNGFQRKTYLADYYYI